MNAILASSEAATKIPKARAVDMKLEVAVIPVADIDRAKNFYYDLGWRVDADFVRDDGSRAVQLTPPGSPSSIHLGENPALFLVVSDIVAARAELAERGVEVTEVFHRGNAGPVGGLAPNRASYGSLASFSDPDGNRWLLQEVTARLPGRVDTNVTTFTSPAELAAAMHRAAVAHGEHETRNGGQRDENWSAWYGEYMVAEQAGEPLPL
ncbi:glyoxalase [Mesorhizobium sp. M1C.F.Ca.ET.193.01.1.1]|uniref:VOC family protein n=1 Tax=unclassified Mesorhizobium TaxID=325217 RepID=UPI000FD5FE88|nr:MULTISPECIES: VOC family protein [unclassified Mesorhizobium]TGS92205.1 glyoxalase [bacterium M00.F.Ca.ET.177.01.1.1]TGQ50092.1 glyoxalase [Mesorhizobium sp. M1C.F.Ca.ET.210.01.1.1]TGQ64784.1 glyoxalase [Mesorhizobium sp. M1C.F.Ca.ET.212.01.1.1]TGQ98566.1 glyoxalase [Mesorhizobium sp. M1C.F.Ca.ET.204.01.1.1]TGR18703.1 glyoxalase [Mesorhizobium sp. M1C.F.Ca.ET.196.01.1.1]